MGKMAKKIGPSLDTVAVLDQPFERSFVPEWDAGLSIGQAWEHDQYRAKMGNKMTPIGPGVARPRGANRRN